VKEWNINDTIIAFVPYFFEEMLPSSKDCSIIKALRKINTALE
jgi:hypothetical protein